MKAQFKYLSFIGTALLIATGSTAAFAQSSRDNSMNMSNNVCSYTPQNRYCIGTNYQNRMMNNSASMNNSDSMTRQNMNTSGSSSQMNQPTNSGSNSNTPVRNTDSGESTPGRTSNEQQQSTPNSMNGSGSSGSSRTSPGTR